MKSSGKSQKNFIQHPSQRRLAGDSKPLQALVLYLLCLFCLCACTPDALDTPAASPNTAASNSEDTAADGPAPGDQRFESSLNGYFDTLTQIIGYAPSRADFESSVRIIEDEFKRYHRLCDIYQSYPGLSNLHDLNRHAGQGPLTLAPELIELLSYARQIGRESDGRVNLAFGAVLKLWHDAREHALADPDTAAPPTGEQLRQAGSHCNLDDLILDPQAKTAELRDPAMSLDLGAIAKGYAVERCAERLRAAGHSNLLISAGGNVRALGQRLRNGQPSPWRVVIQDPQKPRENSYLSLVNLSGDLSLVTSGVYERYFQVGERLYHHIIDPESMEPELRYLSVSVLCPDSGRADALSTWLFQLDLRDGQALVAADPELEALWVLPDGSQVQSAGYARYGSPYQGHN